jgi:hypothetical protein
MGKSFNTGTLVNGLSIDTNGNVGINTVNPDFGSFGATEKILGISNSSSRARLQFQNTSTGTSGVSGTIAFFNSTTQLASLDILADGATNRGAYIFNTNNGTSNAERVRITSSGNVGIGTSNPLVKFQITQPNGIGLPTLGTSTGGLFIAGDGNQYGLYIGNDGNTGNSWLQAMRNNTATSYNILLNPVGGNVGIGTSGPNFLLSVSNSSDIWHAAFGDVTSTGKMIRIGGMGGSGTYGVIGAYSGFTNGSQIPLVLQRDGGNVLIGSTTDNGFKLDVSGRMRANGITSSTGSVSSVYSGTAYGIINVTTRGIYYIFAQLPAGTGDVTNYTSMVIVLSDGSAAKIVANYSAPLLPLTLSGTLISVSQNSGALQPSIVWNFTSQN